MYHRIFIVGNLGRDPELRYIPSGQPVTSLNVATNRQYTDSNGQQVKETTWFRVSVWGRQAEACNQYLRKGSGVLIEGTLTPDLNTGGPRIWTRQDGTPGANFEVRAIQVKFLPSRGEEPGGPPPTDFGTSEVSGDSEEDIPF